MSAFDATRRSDEDICEQTADQAVEHDRFRQCEAEPLDALELAAQLGLAGDCLDHRTEDVADADAGAERAETDAERERDGLPGFGGVARDGRDEKRVHSGPPSGPARSPSR